MFVLLAGFLGLPSRSFGCSVRSLVVYYGWEGEVSSRVGVCWCLVVAVFGVVLVFCVRVRCGDVGVGVDDR